MASIVRTPPRRALLVAAAALLLMPGALAPPPAEAAGRVDRLEVQIVDLGVRDSATHAFAEHINDAGVVIGSFNVGGHEGFSTAFRWEDGIATELPGLGGPSTQADAINRRGQILGRAYTAPFEWTPVLWEADGTTRTLPRAFYTGLNDLGVVAGTFGDAVTWRDGVVTHLGRLAGPSIFTGDGAPINNLGQVTGDASIDDRGTRRAFLWSKGSMVALPTPARATSQATHINDRGQVLGQVSTAEQTSAALWDQHGLTVLPGLPGGRFTLGHDLNDRGAVVGYSAIGGDLTRAFLYQDGTMVDLGTLPGGAGSSANAVNRHGQVVGGSLLQGSFDGHAVLWQDGQIIDLGTLPGGRFSNAVDINRRGQIIGVSENAAGLVRAVMWTVRPAR